MQSKSFNNAPVLMPPRAPYFDVREVLGDSNNSRLFWVPIEKIRYQNGASFFAEQNHLVRYLDYGMHDFQRFFELHQPTCLFTRNFLPAGGMSPQSLAWSPPWDHPGNYAGEGPFSVTHGHQAYGPVSRAKLHWEAERLDRVKASILQRGFVSPSRTDKMVGRVLVTGQAGDGDYRILASGKHRCAVLAHLGWTHIPLVLDRAISLHDVEKWPQVGSGQVSVGNASSFFKSYFREPEMRLLDGW